MKIPAIVLIPFVAAWAMAADPVTPPSVAAPIVEAVAWYDTLGYPDVKNLPYVRVATGLGHKMGNQPWENSFVEGFLVSEDTASFTVFVCSVSESPSPGPEMFEPYAPLTTVRLVRKMDGPVEKQVNYEALDLKKVSAGALERLLQRNADKSFPEGAGARVAMSGGQPVPHRARIFALGRACVQKGLTDTGAALMEFAANIPDFRTGKAPVLREALQRDIGEVVLIQAEKDCAYPKIAWTEMLKVYDHFETRFPASPRIAYAQEAAEVLRKMIAEEAAHHPKPLEQMAPTEQVAENIYQLRNLAEAMWDVSGKYPLVVYDSEANKEVITPVHRLVDLGNVAVPQLIEALDDRRFTRCEEQDWHGVTPPKILRVSDVAQRILEHMSGRNFWQKRAEGGKKVGPNTREQAEAWWAEVRGKGQKQVWIEAASQGDSPGCEAARKLVEKYPEVALAAIEVAVRACKSDALRGEYVEIAGKLPGDTSVAFLKTQLESGQGLYARTHAAEALHAKEQPAVKADAVSAMVEAWRKIQPRLQGNKGDAYSEVGHVIAFLATSGDVRAIEALAQDMAKTPVDVRMAIVEVFLPFPKSFSGGGLGETVNVHGNPNDYMEKLPDGPAGAAIERLLATALDDTERRVGTEGNYNEFSYADPRVCDMAALVLTERWPKKYQFRWDGTSTDCDVEIARLRNQLRAENGLPSLAAPAVVKPATGDEGVGGRIREVRVGNDEVGKAVKFDSAGLKGQVLDGKRLDEIAQQLEAAIPEQQVRGVTFIAERSDDGTGFKVEILWIAGEPRRKGGWSRDLTVRMGHKNVYNTSGWASKNGVRGDKLYGAMAAAFEKAQETELNAPIYARFRVRRGSDR